MNTRQEQLRAAKRRERRRDREAGLALYQVKLPSEFIERLKTGMRDPEVRRRLEAFLRREIVDARDYPQLHLLCWNRRSPCLTRTEALAIYERNWRLVSTAGMTDHERDFLADLATDVGRG